MQDSNNVLLVNQLQNELHIQTLFKQPVNLTLKPQTLFSAMHLFNGKILFLYIFNNQLTASYVNRQTYAVEETFMFKSSDQTIMDYTMIHNQTFLLKDIVLFMCNYHKSAQYLVFYADILKRTVYAFSHSTKPILHRYNYSLTQYKDLKLLLFGGFDDSMKLNNILDSYLIDQFDFHPIQAKGQPPSPRHGHMAITTCQYLIIAGGTQSTNLFERSFLNDTFLFDLQTNVWTQCKINIPKTIALGTTVQISQSQYLHFGDHNQQFYLFNSKDYSWHPMKNQRDIPEYRYNTSTLFDNNQVLLFGGFSFNRNLVICPVLDRLQFAIQGQKHDIDLYRGHPEPKSPIHQEEPKEELTFEELLAQEKELEQLDEMKLKEQQKQKSKKNKKKNKVKK